MGKFIPIVAVKGGGADELIQNGETGFKFDKNDTIENNIKNNFVESSEILEIKEVIEFLNSNSKRGITTFKND